MMWIGSLALAGMPFFSGYFSKDMILEAAFASHSGVGTFAYWCGIAAAFMTAFYSWRLIFMTFHGRPRADEKVMAHVHESPAIMTIPLYFLAVGAVVTGFLFDHYFIGDGRFVFWGSSIFVMNQNDTIEMAHHVAGWVKYLPTIVGIIGILLAHLMYVRSRHLPAVMAGTFSGLHEFFYNKWYFDVLYQRFIVKPAFKIGKFLWKSGDVGTIDRLGPDGVAARVQDASKHAHNIQTGYVYNYAFAMIVGAVVLITTYIVWIH
jgi:NADH-quinone oxidoreductase subunit L